MSVLFCHDHRFIIGADGAVYSSGQYDSALVARYEAAFGEMIIAGRFRPMTESDDPARLTLVLQDSARFVALPNLSSLKSIFTLTGKAEAILAEVASRVDMVIARLPSELGIVAARVGRRLGKPTLVEVVACVFDGMNSHGSLKARLYAPVAMRRMRSAIRLAPNALYVTQSFLQQRYPSAGHTAGISDVILPPVEPGILARRLDQIAQRADATRFGMVAALFHKEKGIDIAIKALSIARQTDPALTLHIVGPGDPSQWQEVARQHGVFEHVEFVGVLPRGEAVLNWLEGIDVYIQASFQEGLPRALLEAMSRATPALASSAGGTFELVDDAWRHTPGDADRLAAQMLAIRPAATRTELARSAFATASGFSSDLLDSRRRAFYSSVLSAPSDTLKTTENAS